jgi:hypothetical protein
LVFQGLENRAEKLSNLWKTQPVVDRQLLAAALALDVATNGVGHAQHGQEIE